MSVLSRNKPGGNLYSKVKKNQFVEKSNLAISDSLGFRNNQNRILMVLSGAINLSLGVDRNLLMETGQMIYLEINLPVKIRATQESSLLFLKIPGKMQFCADYPIEMTMNAIKSKNNPITAGCSVLEIREGIYYYLDTLLDYLLEKFQGDGYQELKMKELNFLLRKFYTMEELTLFFFSSFTFDLDFFDAVRQHSQSCRTVGEIAEMMHYNVADFGKRFRQVFGETPASWLRRKRMELIINELIMTDKSFDDIAREQGFSSRAYFNNFCKANFDQSPANIRKNNKER